jgi:hypothetical protein
MLNRLKIVSVLLFSCIHYLGWVSFKPDEPSISVSAELRGIESCNSNHHAVNGISYNYNIRLSVTIKNNSNDTLKFLRCLSEAPFQCNHDTLFMEALPTPIADIQEILVTETIPPQKTENFKIVVKATESFIFDKTRIFKVGFKYAPPDYSPDNNGMTMPLRCRSNQGLIKYVMKVIWSNEIPLK